MLDKWKTIPWKVTQTYDTVINIGPTYRGFVSDVYVSAVFVLHIMHRKALYSEYGYPVDECAIRDRKYFKTFLDGVYTSVFCDIFCYVNKTWIKVDKYKTYQVTDTGNVEITYDYLLDYWTSTGEELYYDVYKIPKTNSLRIINHDELYPLFIIVEVIIGSIEDCDYSKEYHTFVIPAKINSTKIPTSWCSQQPIDPTARPIYIEVQNVDTSDVP